MVEFNLLKMMNYFCTPVYKKDTALYLQYDFDKNVTTGPTGQSHCSRGCI